MIITKTPLRVSFFGGGSDFPVHCNVHGGACLSAAIDKYIYVCVSGRYDGKTAVNYGSTHEIVTDPGSIKHDLIREISKFLQFNHGITTEATETTTIADITGRGSGLGSSSSLTVGAIRAYIQGYDLVEGLNVSSTPDLLSQTANRIELDILSRPQGFQDAYPAAYGGVRLYEFGAHAPRVHAPIKPKTAAHLFDNLLLFNTGITRQSQEVLKEQHAKTADNADQLNVLATMAKIAYKMLQNGELYTFGRLLHEGWTVKKKLSNSISNELIDRMYTEARKAGAIGGKVCGAGAGGYLLLYVTEERQTAVRRALSDFNELPILPEEKGSHVIYNG